MYMMQISKVSSSNEPGTENLFLGAGMMLSHRLLVAGMMLAPQSKCSVPGSFENETLLICIIYIQEKVHQSIQKANTGLP